MNVNNALAGCCAHLDPLSLILLSLCLLLLSAELFGSTCRRERLFLFDSCTFIAHSSFCNHTSRSRSISMSKMRDSGGAVALYIWTVYCRP